eukprot:COSAG02_NODE_59810_length_273_cov_0.597701_1_plen_79_part_01
MHGIYEPISEPGDAPCFRNEHGVLLWYSREDIRWHAGDREGADLDPKGTMHIDADDGRLPVGGNTWAVKVSERTQKFKL